MLGGTSKSAKLTSSLPLEAETSDHPFRIDQCLKPEMVAFFCL